MIEFEEVQRFDVSCKQAVFLSISQMKIQIVNNKDPNMYDTKINGKIESVYQRINAPVCNECV